MNIDNTIGEIFLNPGEGFSEGSRRPHINRPSAPVELSFSGEYSSFLDKSLDQADTIELKLVAESQTVLEGIFDTPEGSRQAAERILTLGI